jgi:hypothetical protein
MVHHLGLKSGRNLERLSGSFGGVVSIRQDRLYRDDEKNLAVHGIAVFLLPLKGDQTVGSFARGTSAEQRRTYREKPCVQWRYARLGRGELDRE